MRLGILPTPWHDTFRSSILPARPEAAPFLIIIYRPFFPPRYSRMKIVVCMLDFGCRCYSIGRSTLWQDQSPGQTNPPPRRIVLCPPDPYRAKELPGRLHAARKATSHASVCGSRSHILIALCGRVLWGIVPKGEVAASSWTFVTSASICSLHLVNGTQDCLDLLLQLGQMQLLVLVPFGRAGYIINNLRETPSWREIVGLTFCEAGVLHVNWTSYKVQENEASQDMQLIQKLSDDQKRMKKVFEVISGSYEQNSNQDRVR
nr:photosystem I PsaA/PsaB [Tanacetum cinerariifolium]